MRDTCAWRQRSLAAGFATLFIAGCCWFASGQAPPQSRVRVLAHGAGTTLLEGGSGSPDYVPVFTKVAFHAETVDGVATGGFECLAIGPSAKKGAGSANFSENIMYVTGNVETASVEGNTIRITGNSDCTGIGAGANVPYEAVIRKGGPGATIVLRAGTPAQVFREVLIEGVFDIFADK